METWDWIVFETISCCHCWILYSKKISNFLSNINSGPIDSVYSPYTGTPVSLFGTSAISLFLYGNVSADEFPLYKTRAAGNAKEKGHNLGGLWPTFGIRIGSGTPRMVVWVDLFGRWRTKLRYQFCWLDANFGGRWAQAFANAARVPLGLFIPSSRN